MKKVLDASSVAHYWANQTQSEGRVQAGNFYFYNDVIYSYGRHFPIAVHYKGIVLFTTQTYSNATAKHIWAVRSACSHITKVFCAHPLLAANGGHSENLDVWSSNIKRHIAAMVKARKKSKWIDAIAYEISQVTAYLSVFPKIKLNKEQKSLFAAKSLEQYDSIIQAEKVAIQAAKVKQAKFYAQVQTKGKKIYDGYMLAWYDYAQTAYTESLTATEKKLANAYNKTLVDTGMTTLRSNGVEVETSKGIKLPVDVAKRYYLWFTKIVAKGGCVDCKYKILDYDVTKADDYGLTVGCHNISIEEINRLATQLNWK